MCVLEPFHHTLLLSLKNFNIMTAVSLGRSIYCNEITLGGACGLGSHVAVLELLSKYDMLISPPGFPGKPFTSLT